MAVEVIERYRGEEEKDELAKSLILIDALAEELAKRITERIAPPPPPPAREERAVPPVREIPAYAYYPRYTTILSAMSRTSVTGQYTVFERTGIGILRELVIVLPKGTSFRLGIRIDGTPFTERSDVLAEWSARLSWLAVTDEDSTTMVAINDLKFRNHIRVFVEIPGNTAVEIKYAYRVDLEVRPI